MPDGRAKQRQATRAQILGFIDPGDSKTLERFDGVGGVILHAAKDDDAVAGRFDLVAEYFELVAQAQSSDFALDQPLA